VTQQNIRTFF